MKLQRAHLFELDPNEETRVLLAKHAGAARFAYNWSLARRIERFNTKEGKEKFTNAAAEHRDLVKLKQTEFPWLYEVSKCAPEEAIRNLDRAFTSYWKRRGEGVGFPRFKKKYKSRDSFRLYGSIAVEDRHVRLPRIGRVRLKEKVRGRVTGEIVSATISRVADRWFVSIAMEQEIADPKPVVGPRIGVDLGISCFAALSDGKKIFSPRPLEAAQKKLVRANRQHSRKQKGSKNRRKSAQRVVKIHAHIANVRRDFINKFTTALAKTKSEIVVEDLHVAGMVKNRSLARAISDQGWSEVRRQLAYKTKWYGSSLIVAGRFFPSSKLCSTCGVKKSKMPLSVRSWECDGCGTLHDRDTNAAINLEKYPGLSGKLNACGDPSDGGTPFGTVYESRVAEAGSLT